MKLLKYIFISLLVLGVALIAPAKTETIPVRLPLNLNAALCVNNWDRALTLVQQMLNSPSLTAGDRTSLITLSTQIKTYQISGRAVDQSNACADAIAPSQGSNITISLSPNSNCISSTLAVNGRCLSNGTAVRRFSRSLEEGDRPSELE